MKTLISKLASLSQSAKNSLGSVLTVFCLDEWGNEIENVIGHPFSDPEPTDEAEEDEIIEDLIGKATVMIQDKVDKLDLCFTSHAEAVAKHNSVRLVDLEELVDLVVKWYDHMPNDIRALLPLQKMYVLE